jgi:hypothetical protein
MKKDVSKKLALNKKTIARLNLSEMKKSLAGARPSRIGISCHTAKCCYSKKVCDPE